MNRSAIISELRAQELSLHLAEVRNSRGRVSRLLADDFLEFCRSGCVYDKTAIIELLANENSTASPPVIDDFTARFLSPEVAPVTYRTVTINRETLRSSIWRLEGGNWRMTFHQGTPV